VRRKRITVAQPPPQSRETNPSPDRPRRGFHPTPSLSTRTISTPARTNPRPPRCHLRNEPKPLHPDRKTNPRTPAATHETNPSPPHPDRKTNPSNHTRHPPPGCQTNPSPHPPPARPCSARASGSPRHLVHRPDEYPKMVTQPSTPASTPSLGQRARPDARQVVNAAEWASCQAGVPMRASCPTHAHPPDAPDADRPSSLNDIRPLEPVKAAGAAAPEHDRSVSGHRREAPPADAAEASRPVPWSARPGDRSGPARPPARRGMPT
jgi:hypothetical protein